MKKGLLLMLVFFMVFIGNSNCIQAQTTMEELKTEVICNEKGNVTIHILGEQRDYTVYIYDRPVTDSGCVLFKKISTSKNQATIKKMPDGTFDVFIYEADKLLKNQKLTIVDGKLTS